MSRIPSQQEYESNELRSANRREAEINASPLSERKENQATLLHVMQHEPELLAERASWLIDGNYGFGQRLMAEQLLNNPRMNHKAGLTLLTGLYEWMCPRNMVIDAWKKLTTSQKARLDKALDVVISDYREHKND